MKLRLSFLQDFTLASDCVLGFCSHFASDHVPRLLFTLASDCVSGFCSHFASDHVLGF